MAECQNFFEHPSPDQCQLGSSTEQLAQVQRMDCADQGLELRLGPSVDVNKPKQHEMVRPIPLYPSVDRQRSGNLTQMLENAALFRGHSDVVMADKVLFSKDSAFTMAPRISREQVWQTLQKTKDVFPHEDACGTKALGDDGALSVWGRRAASMQIVMPSSEVSDADACPVRRSCSNGVLLSRQLSFSQETLVDESSDPAGLSLCSQQHEDLELRNRRAMQAHRRLVARKRRRLLLEVKQQRKKSQNSGSINRHGVSQQEKAAFGQTRSVDHTWALQQHPKTHDESVRVEPGEVNDMKDQCSNRNVAHCDELSPVKKGMLKRPFGDKGHDNTLGDSEKMMMHEGYDNSLGNSETIIMHMECESNSGGSKLIQGDQIDSQNVAASQGLTLCAKHGLNQVGKDADLVEGMKCTPSSCSETESIEKKGRNNPCREMDSSEQESSQKSSTEDRHDRTGLTNVSHSKPMLYPRGSPHTTPFGILETHAACASQISTPCTGTPVASFRNDGNQKRHSTTSACKPADPTADMATIGFAIKRSVGVFSEGKWKTADEKSAFLPIRRTTSNILEASTDPQSSTKELEACVTGAASQLKFARMGFADATFRNRTDASGENPLMRINKACLQNVSVKKECDSYSEEETPIATLKCQGPSQDKLRDGSSASGMGGARVKIKEEDMAIFDPHQESDTFNRHSEVLDRQRSVSFLDLPCVTTTGTGPNGKTIDGVMYITSGRGVWLVCRCHGRHMSPTEFVEHSGSTDLSNPLKSIVVNPSPFFNQVASTPV